MWMEFSPLVKGANSCEKLEEGLYYMEYKGDDGFDGLMAKGGFESADQLASYAIEFLSKGHYKPEVKTKKDGFGCSALTVRTPDGDVLMGRNFDFPSAIGVIMHCIPDKGYETITTFNVEFYGFLTGLFVALDGINEKGLAIADLMAGDTVETHQRTSKPDLTTTAAIAYMLKNAANVDEALKLLEGIDMHSDIGSAHHYAMADASGKSVVVEYVDNKMVVVESPAVANHYLCEQKLNVGLEEGDDRYDKLCQRFDETHGVMSKKQLTEAIAVVSQPMEQREQSDARIGSAESRQRKTEGQPQREGFLGTAWSMVMDLSHPSVTYYSRRHFSKSFHFELSRR